MITLLQTVIDTTGTSVVSTGSSWFEWKVTVGDALTLIGIVIAIIEYGINARKSREQALTSQKETWFLNVIVLPQLDDINKFYQTLISNIETDKSTVSESRKKSYEQCLIEVAELKKQRKDEINNFFDHVSALVMSYDENLGREVNAIVMALEDVYVKAIDGYMKDEDEGGIRALLLHNKQLLIAKLNSGLKK